MTAADGTFKPVIKALQEVRTHATSCSSRHGVTHDEPLHGVAILSLSVDDVENGFMEALSLRQPRSPVVSSTPAVFGCENVFSVVQIGVL